MAHHHSHSPSGTRSKKILFAGILNIGFTIIEIIGGIMTNSVAILSDALHDLGDSISLVTAYFAEKQSERPADSEKTFGYARFSLFSALFTAVVLLVGSVFILIEAVQRLFNPEPVLAGGMILLAVFGVAVNFVAYFRLHGGSSTNEKVLSLHLMEDVLGWVAVLIGAIIIYFTDFYLIDPVLTIGYTLYILWGVVGSLKEVVNLFMQGMPQGININEVTEALVGVPEVVSVHDIHIWSLDGEHNISTGHLVVSADEFHKYAEVRKKVNEKLKNYRVVHTTIEIEEDGSCPDGDCRTNLS